MLTHKAINRLYHWFNRFCDLRSSECQNYTQNFTSFTTVKKSQDWTTNLQIPSWPRNSQDLEKIPSNGSAENSKRDDARRRTYMIVW